MNLKACTFERLAFISLGFGRGAQLGKTSLLEVEIITAQASTLSVFIFIWYTSGPGIPPKPSIFGRRCRTFLRTLGNSKPCVYVFFQGFVPVLAMAFISLQVKSFGHSQRAKCKRNESMCQFVYAKALNLPFSPVHLKCFAGLFVKPSIPFIEPFT